MAVLEEDNQRCDWSTSDPVYIQYHDREWGKEVTDDLKMFEFLVLESAQAGLSWITILKRRDAYRNAFADYNAEKVAGMAEQDMERLMQDTPVMFLGCLEKRTGIMFLIFLLTSRC